jgi:hypothetical protein
MGEKTDRSKEDNMKSIKDKDPKKLKLLSKAYKRKE